VKHVETEYPDAISYWPSLEAGKIGFLLVSILGFTFIINALWTLSDATTIGVKIKTIVVVSFAGIGLYMIFRKIYRAMYIQITISVDSIVIENKRTAFYRKISWEDVSEVYFHQENWFGRKTCRIYLKQDKMKEKKDFEASALVLPIFSVDENKLVEIIPKCLWKNHPWYS